MSSLHRYLSGRCRCVLALAGLASLAVTAPGANLSAAWAQGVAGSGTGKARIAPATPGTCVNLDNAVRTGLVASPTLGEAEAAVQASAARLDQILATGRPQLSVYSRAADGEIGLTTGRTDNQAGVVVSYRLFDFGKTRFQRLAAEARLAASRAGRQESRLEEAAAIAEAFLNVLEAREALAAAEAREARFEALAGDLPRQLETGVVTAQTAAGIRADVAVARANRVDVALSLSEAEVRFHTLIDARIDACPGTDDVDALLVGRLPPPDADLEGVALDASARRARLKAEEAAARNEVIRAKRANLPTLDVEAAAAQVYDEVLETWNDGNRIGLAFSTPLYSGGGQLARTAEARAEVRTAELNRARLERDLREAVRLNRARLVAAAGLADARIAARDSLDVERQALGRAFELGQTPYREVARAEADYQAAVMDAIEATYAARQARLALLYLVDRIPGADTPERAD